jgi:hypothetical protein
VRTLGADFTKPIDLPPLDGIVMANSLQSTTQRRTRIAREPSSSARRTRSLTSRCGSGKRDPRRASWRDRRAVRADVGSMSIPRRRGSRRRVDRGRLTLAS